jgi:hypothetical protein
MQAALRVKNTQNGKLALDGKAEMLNNGCVA